MAAAAVYNANLAAAARILWPSLLGSSPSPSPSPTGTTTTASSSSPSPPPAHLSPVKTTSTITRVENHPPPAHLSPKRFRTAATPVSSFYPFEQTVPEDLSISSSSAARKLDFPAVDGSNSGDSDSLCGSSNGDGNSSFLRHRSSSSSSSSEYKYHCPDCPKSYSTSSNLARHRQTHRYTTRRPPTDEVFKQTVSFSFPCSGLCRTRRPGSVPTATRLMSRCRLTRCTCGLTTRAANARSAGSASRGRGCCRDTLGLIQASMD